jgi:hypothetical protein
MLYFDDQVLTTSSQCASGFLPNFVSFRVYVLQTLRFRPVRNEFQKTRKYRPLPDIG